MTMGLKAAFAALAAALIIFGCVGSMKPTDAELKSCAGDSDCSVEYGVWYNGSCVRGCFNSEKSANGLVREQCRGTMYDYYPAGTGCTCTEGVCVLSPG